MELEVNERLSKLARAGKCTSTNVWTYLNHADRENTIHYLCTQGMKAGNTHARHPLPHTLQEAV